MRVHPEWLARQNLTPGASDLPERARRDEYIQAYEEAITATSTAWAPWYVIPADHRPVMRGMVARILVDTIRSLDLSWPEISETDDVVLADAQRRLLAESA